MIDPKASARLLERVQQSAWLNVESDIHPESVGLSDEVQGLPVTEDERTHAIVAVARIRRYGLSFVTATKEDLKEYWIFHII